MAIFAVIPEDMFKVVYGSTKIPLPTMFFYVGWAYAFLLAGMSLARALQGKAVKHYTTEDDHRDLKFLKFLGYTSLALAGFSYAVYFLSSGLSLGDIIRGFSGEAGASYALRRELENIPGVTSLMNVAPWWYVYVAFKVLIAHRKLNKIEIGLSFLLFTLVTLRGLAAFERRAIYDLFVPAFVLLLLRKRDWTAKGRSVIATLPLTGVLFVVVVFLVAEYFKTWVNYYAQNTDMTFLAWGLVRLAGYYATAINNGVTALQDGLQTGGAIALSGLYKLPLIGDMLALGEARAEMSMQYKLMLTRVANPEFNNPGGAIATFVDFGVWGGAAFLLFHGILFSWIWVRSRQGSILFVLLYTLVFSSLLEISRIWFFTTPFGFLNLVYLPVIYHAYKKLPRKLDVQNHASRVS